MYVFHIYNKYIQKSRLFTEFFEKTKEYFLKTRNPEYKGIFEKTRNFQKRGIFEKSQLS